MKVKCLLIIMLVLFVNGILASSSYAKLDPKTIIGLWLFNEGSGNVTKDSSGNKNNGKFVNNPKWVDGKFGKGLAFDGATNYLDCGTSDTLRITGKTITVTAWIKTDKNCNQGYIYGRYNAVGPWEGYGMSIGGNLTNGLLGFWYGNNTNWDFSVMTVNDNNWHHVATVFDSVQTKFYIDGKLDATVKIAGNVLLDSTGKPAGIGCDISGPGRYYNGILDEVAVFNVMVEEADINDIRNKGFVNVLAVDTSGKLAATWADIKTQ